jgi:DNA polymerase I-like protein with 3'-5' exonuclease and polymerase domains
MFGIDESDPLWKPARRACKTYIFGRNYGGGLRGIFERVVKAVPQLNLTYARFTEIDRTYRRAHPQYVKWVKKITERVKATRKLENGVGRVRFFLGTPDQIVREGLNFPIQSLAADVLNRALIDIHSLFKNYEYAKLVGTVHDSVLLEVRDKYIGKIVKEVKKIMEQPFEIRGEKVSFPVGDPTEGVICSVGKSWGKLKDYK